MLTDATRQRAAAVDKGGWMEMLRCMYRGRRTEERLIRLYHQGKIYGGVYTGVGQEAIGAASTAASEPHDLFAPCIRNITVHLGRGQSILNIFRQWLARASGPTRGRDGNVHFGDLQQGVYTMISHLGAMISVVTGGVMARRLKGQPSVGFAYIGDGATSTGDFHEAVNFAAVYSVPLVVLIENNKYAYSTPQCYQFRCERLADKAAGYGIQGYSLDGNDAVGLHLALRELVADIRQHPRPVLVECDTMRMRGHGEHDDFSYVPKELIERYAARDPLLVARKRLEADGIFTAAEIDEIDASCQREVEQAYRQALAEPPPDPRTLLDGVYSP